MGFGLFNVLFWYIKHDYLLLNFFLFLLNWWNLG